MRLRQVSTVAEYTSQFEALSNRLRGVSEQNRLSCFLSGLKDDIRLPVRMLHPPNLGAAFGLAKLQEVFWIVVVPLNGLLCHHNSFLISQMRVASFLHFL